MVRTVLMKAKLRHIWVLPGCGFFKMQSGPSFGTQSGDRRFLEAE
jgi:hypothetical protein